MKLGFLFMSAILLAFFFFFPTQAPKSNSLGHEGQIKFKDQMD